MKMRKIPCIYVPLAPLETILYLIVSVNAKIKLKGLDLPLSRETNKNLFLENIVKQGNGQCYA